MYQSTTSSRPFDPIFFWVSASVIIFSVLWSIIFVERMSATINCVFSWTTATWAWLCLLTAFLVVVGYFALMGGK